MEQAYNAVLENKLSMKHAAKEYGVPRMTLSDRVKGCVPINVKLNKLKL